MDYKTVAEYQTEHLDRGVNRFLADGYELKGEVKVIDKRDGVMFVQTLVRNRQTQGGKRRTRRNQKI